MKKVLSMALLVAAMLGTSVGASAQAHRHHRRAARPQTVSIRAEVRNPRFGNSFDRKDARVVRCNRCAPRPQDMHRCNKHHRGHRPHRR